jgi:membrane-bound metal-dependent hydrolase YbcI (DUF457 family)
MFVGHLAVALGTKSLAPRVPLAALVAAVFGLDLLWGPFLLLGLETVRIAPGDTAFTPLAFEHYPWSHSLAMAAVWAAVAGSLAALNLQNQRFGLLVAFAVLSHWLLDVLTHRPDLPLWPGGPEYGLGLWNSIAGTLIVEGLLFAIAIEMYRRAFRVRDGAGKWSFWGLIVLTSVIWVSGPFSPPPPSVQALATVATAMWIFPIWAMWIDRHRTAWLSH